MNNKIRMEDKMKKIILLAVLLTSYIFPQQPDPYSFFPSAVGNVWEYSTTNGHMRNELYKDSIDTPNSKYIFLTYNDYYETYPDYKIDSLNKEVIYLPGKLDWLYYKLDVDSGDTWLVDSSTSLGAKVKQKYPALVFGKPTVIMKIYYGPMVGDSVVELEGWSEYIAAGFGEVEYFDESGGGPQRILVGAIIDGDTSGTITAIEDNKGNNIPSEYLCYIRIIQIRLILLQRYHID